MSVFKGAMKTGIALKIMDLVRREAAKPHNQAKARELFERISSRTAKTRGRSPSRDQGEGRH